MMGSLHYFKYLLGLKRPFTVTSAAEQKCLREHASGKKRLCEIGVFHGVNTRVFREVMAPDGYIIAIDPFPRFFFGLRNHGWTRLIAHNEVSKVKNGRVVWIEELGKDAPRNPEVTALLPVDFIFIDGDHSWDGIRGDWENWSGHIAPNGIVTLHDSCNTDQESARYTSEVILKDARFTKIHEVDMLTVLRRNED